MIALSLALGFAAALAFAGFVLWLKHLEKRLATNEDLTILTKHLAEWREVTAARDAQTETVIKMLAEDWHKKFGQLEGDWKALEGRLNTQFSGEMAQSNSTRGYNRG